MFRLVFGRIHAERSPCEPTENHFAPDLTAVQSTNYHWPTERIASVLFLSGVGLIVVPTWVYAFIGITATFILLVTGLFLAVAGLVVLVSGKP